MHRGACACPLFVVVALAGPACKDQDTGPSGVKRWLPGGESAEDPRANLLVASTGLARPPRVEGDCPDVAAAARQLTPPPPAVAQGLHGGGALTADDLAFMDQARQCREGDTCLSVDEACNCGFAVIAAQADAWVRDVRGKFTCDADPCCTWGTGKGAAVCRAGRCVFVDPAAEILEATLGSGPPPSCPDRDDEQAKAKARREVAGMAGIRGGAGLTAGDVIILKNSAGCGGPDRCVRVPDPCNCGWTVNAGKADSVRRVVANIKCAKRACCQWKGPPECRSGTCQDTW
ncbi:MAG: hypothetical protein HY904_26560 [Deltaproteobacteria bacterium]|nr:hypothetical protein [Deltaproteobacteria bacterium]